jgi:hypothetical protein
VTRSRGVVVLGLLCLLASCAIAAPGAAAEGTTAFTCKKVTPVEHTAGFKDAHCKNVTSAFAEYEHVEIAAGTKTEVSGTNLRTEGEVSTWSLHSSVAGVELEVQATGLTATGSMTNSISGAERLASGSGSATFTGVKVTKPAGKGCIVKTDQLPKKEPGAEGVVDTTLLKATTAGQGDGVKFEPIEGVVLASFFVEKCTTLVLNGTYEVTGSLVSSNSNGATVDFTEETTTKLRTLKLDGVTAGIEGSLTLSGRDPTLKETQYTPLSATTIIP